MSQAIREQITKELGVEPILINSALVSAQNRQRLYWTNIPGVEQPDDRNILLRDILESGLPLRENGIRNMVGNNVDSKTCVAIPILHAAAGRMVGRRINEHGKRDDYNEAIPRYQRFEVNENPQKTNCLSTVEKDNMVAIQIGATMPHIKYEPLHSCEVLSGMITIKDKKYNVSLPDGIYIIRKLSVTECKRLQTVPNSYVFPVSNCQAYKMLGNGWTVDVVAHILGHAPGITTEPMEVLSMYDGMSCGHIALDKLEVHITRYYATEIDKYAIATTQHNYPETIQLGDAFQVREEGWTLPL